jgi:hypothetical protein
MEYQGFVRETFGNAVFPEFPLNPTPNIPSPPSLCPSLSAAEKLQCPEIVSLNQKRSGGFFRFEGSRNRSKRSVVVASSPTGAKTA